MIRIEAPHFVAGFDRETGQIAPILRYMFTWTDKRIMDYCQSKGWTFQFTGSNENNKE